MHGSKHKVLYPLVVHRHNWIKVLTATPGELETTGTQVLKWQCQQPNSFTVTIQTC